MTFATVEVSHQRFADAEKLLTVLPFEMRTAVLVKAIRAAAAPVVKWCRALAPDSVKTGTRELWSKSLRQKRSSTKQLVESIGVSSTREYGATMAVYVGPLWPAGNLINVIGHTHAQMLWGRSSEVTIKPNNFVEQAGEISKAEQGAEFTKTFETQSKAILKRLAKP